jgi:hypothetical protein
MKLELTVEDARFLQQQLARHARSVEDELAHTDKRALQRELASDLARLQRIAHGLERLLDDDAFDSAPAET